jgi:hypothetical protein
VVENTLIARLYREMIHGQDEWPWFLQPARCSRSFASGSRTPAGRRSKVDA